MYNNNLLLDFNKKTKIPQNSNNFYEFNSFYFKNSIEIIIKPFEDIDHINLFIILKSFVHNIKYPPGRFLIAVKNEDFFVLNNIDISNIKKMSYLSFYNWFVYRIENDRKYIRKDGIYKFIITYPIEIFDRKEIEYLRPIYPWSLEILNSLTILIEEESNKDRIIKNQEEKIKILENKIKYLEDKFK